MTSAHSRYRSRLLALADDVVLRDAVAMASGTPGPDDGQLVRHYGRFHPDASPWAVLAISTTRDDLPLRVEIHAEAVDGTVAHVELGHIRVVACTADPALPGLACTLEQLDESRIVRYRPGKRCTVRGSMHDDERIVKLVSDVEQRHADAVALWASATRGRLCFDVARPLGASRRLGAVHQGIVAGTGVTAALFGSSGDACAHRLGRALGSLAISDVRPVTTAPPSSQLDRTRRAAGRVATRIPALAGRVRAVVEDLEQRHRALRRRALVPVHGAPHADQWLDNRGRLGLVDFDRFALGEPELDVATLLAELDTERLLALAVSRIEQAVVTGFESIGPALDIARLVLYRRHKRAAKVTRTAWSLRPDADERAERHLALLEF